MSTLIWGAGAIGGTLGAYFARAGVDVTLVDTVAEHVAAVMRDGLRVTGPIDEFTVGVPAFVPDALAGTWDEIILATKAHHTDTALPALRPHLSDGGYVVSAQNGLNEIAIADAVGAARTVGAFVNFGADYLGPGVIHFGGRGAVVVGEIDGRVTARITSIRDAWHHFDPRAIATANIWGYLWGKLGYGALLFATALTNESIADALASKRHLPVYRKLGEEATSVARAKKIKCLGFNGYDPEAFSPDAPIAATQASIDAMVVHNRKSAKTHSGIWRDLAVRKRKTEIDAQIAIIAEIAKPMGLKTPTIERLVALIHDVEDGRRPQDWKTLDALLEAVPA